ncbi:MAG: hypothetical protein [Circular genetic element sp.]|nr:MAG: hypothetical protein [Circular genetic element sp.]
MAQMEETVLVFKIEDSIGETYIDIAKCMSMVNRKLYRQQGLWDVRGVQLFGDALDTNLTNPERVGLPYTVAISGAPRTWVTRNSLVKAFHAWIDQQNKALEAAGSRDLKPRWQDFKVWLNENHRQNGDITPVSGHMFGGDDPYQLGEWIQSKIVWEEVDGAGLVVEQEPEMVILGPTALPANVALIDQYGDSRALPHSPDPVTPTLLADNMYTQSHDALGEQMEEVTANMKTDNNEPPYQQVNYPGGDGNGHEPLLFGFVANSTGSTNGRKSVMNGFAAPNGLLELQYNLDLTRGTSEAPLPDLTVPELWLQVVIGRRSDY